MDEPASTTSTQEAQGAQGVVLGEYLVSSAVATVLFDSGVSHSFISSSFVEKHNIPTVLLKTPLLTGRLEVTPIGLFYKMPYLSAVEIGPSIAVVGGDLAGIALRGLHGVLASELCVRGLRSCHL